MRRLMIRLAEMGLGKRQKDYRKIFFPVHPRFPSHPMFLVLLVNDDSRYRVWQTG